MAFIAFYEISSLRLFYETNEVIGAKDALANSS